MEILIEAPFNITDDKKKIIENKIESLAKYNINITTAKVFFKLDDTDKPNGVLAELLTHVKGPEIFAKASAEDFMEAFHKVVSQVERQLRDRKDKRTDKHKDKLWKQL